MFFVPIIAGWALGVTSAKLIDDQQSRAPLALPAKPSPMQAGIDAIQKFKKEKIDSIRFDSYSEQLKNFSLEEEELSEEERMANQLLVNSSILFASTAICALVYSPLVYLHIPPMLYLGLPFYKQGFEDLFYKKKVTTVVVDTILAVGSLSYTVLTPSILVIGTAGGLLMAFNNKIVTQSKDNTRKSLTNLFGEQPKYLWIVKDGIEIEVPFESVQADDLVVVDAGQMIPVDGTIYDGVASIDQHMLTGESQPAEKGTGDLVFAATVVLSGKIYIQVEKTGVETAAAQIGHILTETSSFTSSVQLRGQEIADQAALPTLLSSGLTLPFFGADKALAVLFSGIGYNMRILGPLSVLNYLQVTARQGILIKDGRALEQVSKIDTIVFDKTGTLTLEQPHVGTIYSYNGYTEQELLTYAAAAEERQAHPIARAIREEAQERQLELPSISEASYEIGYGIQVTLDEKLIRVGSNRFMAMESIAMPEEITSVAKEAHQQGHTLVYVAIDEQFAGAIELVPTVRPEAKRIVNHIRQLGIEMYIISGDHERPTRALAEELGIEHYFAETLPENKADHIERLQEEGKFVCFIGDGINDAIALKKAQVSISLRGASTIATDTAQIILMDKTLNQLEELFTISQQFESNMHMNLISTVVPGVIIIGGALLGFVGYAGATALFFIGMGAGVINAMRPLFNTPENRENAAKVVHLG